MSNGDDVLDNWEEIDEAGLDSRLDQLKKTQREASRNEIEDGEQQQQEFSESTMSFQNSIPMMMVMQQTENEYQSSNYSTKAMPMVKILRRPAQQNSGGDRDNGLRPKQPIKTLQQREQEYAEARLRILGAAKNPEDELDISVAEASTMNISTQMPNQQPSLSTIHLNNRMVLPGGRSPALAMNNPIPPSTGIFPGVGDDSNFLTPTSSMMLGGANTRYNGNVLRMPRGPDGTTGFQMRR